jgi:hypothetical protein
MNSQFPNSQSNSQPKLDKAMTTEQFNQIVEAILAGKYSWACVLILRFAGYNPLHYIPYTTYIRLAKDNQAEACDRKAKKVTSSHPQDETKYIGGNLNNLSDLNYLENLKQESTKIRGGDRNKQTEKDGICQRNSTLNYKDFRDKFLSQLESQQFKESDRTNTFSDSLINTKTGDLNVHFSQVAKIYPKIDTSQNDSVVLTLRHRIS